MYLPVNNAAHVYEIQNTAKSAYSEYADTIQDDLTVTLSYNALCHLITFSFNSCWH